MNENHNFRIAISYSGRNRDFVKQVDQELLKHLDHSEVFYDQRYSALMARPDLDGWLRNLFRDQSDLVVCFLSQGHQDSPWCQVESNAVRECFQNNPDVPPPLLFTDSKYDLGMGFSMDHAQSIENLTPKQVAGMILERFDYHYPNARLRNSGKKTYVTAFFITLTFLLVVGGMNKDDLLPLVEGFSFDLDENNYGVMGLSILVIPLMFGMYRVMTFLRPKIRTPEYVDPPAGGGPPGSSDWERYARELEHYTDTERQNLTARLNDVRERRHILMASIVLSIFLVIGHFAICLLLERSKGEDRPPFLPHASSEQADSDGQDESGQEAGSEAPAAWSFQEVFIEHRGHRALAAYYLITVFIFSFVVNRRTGRPLATAAFMGGWQPLYLGIIYVLFIATQNYEALFDADGGEQGYFEEPGNFYVMERIVIVPSLCWIAALIAGGLGAMTRKKTPTPTSE